MLQEITVAMPVSPNCHHVSTKMQINKYVKEKESEGRLSRRWVLQDGISLVGTR